MATSLLNSDTRAAGDKLNAWNGHIEQTRTRLREAGVHASAALGLYAEAKTVMTAEEQAATGATAAGIVSALVADSLAPLGLVGAIAVLGTTASPDQHAAATAAVGAQFVASITAAIDAILNPPAPPEGGGE
ncbi:MAG: hypothetical protein ACRCT8_12050 [Lacipirellulaceae bacterium]